VLPELLQLGMAKKRVKPNQALANRTNALTMSRKLVSIITWSIIL
jgi:hypothetical protein